MYKVYEIYLIEETNDLASGTSCKRKRVTNESEKSRETLVKLEV